jgi:hypothetical protein
MEGGEDGMRNIWDQGSWQRADIEGWTKATMGCWSPRMMVGLQEFLDGSSSSVPSNMLSMGGDLVDERRRHGVQGSRLLRMPIFLLPC